MARKQLKFINSFLNIFKRSKKNKVAQIEDTKNITTKGKQKGKTKEEKGKSFFRYQRNNYKTGGVGDRGLGAIYFPPSRGKIKGYMKKAS